MPYTREAWSTPKSELEADDYCRVCLIDTNPQGEPKTKDNCKLPIRRAPGGPIYINALTAAFAALRGGRTPLKGVSAADRKKAAKALRSHYRKAGLDVPEPLDQMAG